MAHLGLWMGEASADKKGSRMNLNRSKMNVSDREALKTSYFDRTPSPNRYARTPSHDRISDTERLKKGENLVRLGKVVKSPKNQNMQFSYSRGHLLPLLKSYSPKLGHYGKFSGKKSEISKFPTLRVRP